MKSKLTVATLLTALLVFVIVTVLVLTENAPTAHFNHAFYLLIALIAAQIHPTLKAAATWIGNLTHWYSYAPIILLLLLLPRTSRHFCIGVLQF